MRIIDMQNKKGFTMAELLVVIIIVAMMAAMAFVGFAFFSADKVTGYSRELLGDLQRARQDAMTRKTTGPGAVPTFSRGFGVRFLMNPAPPNNPQYVIFEFDDCNGDYDYDTSGCGGAGGREEFNAVTRDLSSNYQLLVNGNPPANDVIIFDYMGVPRLANWGLGIVGLRIGQDSSKYDPGDIVTERCISVSLNRIREGVWNDVSVQCDEQ